MAEPKPKSKKKICPEFLLKVVFTMLFLLGIKTSANAAIFDWLGATSSDVTVASNWWNESTLSNGVPGNNDDVYIGVNATYTYVLVVLPLTANINLTTMPVVGTTTTWKSLTFGYYGPQGTYTSGTNETISLTVNSGATLTIVGNVMQKHNPSVSGTPFNYITTTIAGAGTLLCRGELWVGDGVTQPANNVADITKLALQISQITITGNIVLNSNGNNATNANAGICYPWLSVEKGTTTILKQVTFVKSFTPLLSGFNTYNPVQTIYKGYGLFTGDYLTGSPNTIEFQNKQPIVPADNFYVYFTFGGNNGTTLFDDPLAENQTVYTANEPSVTTTATYIATNSPSYFNLTLSGVSPKAVDKNSTLGTSTPQGLSVGGLLTTSGGVVNLTGNNPTVTTVGGWTNSTTVTQGTGTITVGGAFSNTGTFTCGSASVTYKGGYTNSSVFTASTGMIYFTGAQNLKDISTNGTTFNKVTFNSPSATATTATMQAGTGNFILASTGTLTMTTPASLVAGSTTLGGAAYLTLKSDANSTATIGPISGVSTISGYVNVQRFVTGGSGYRGYRLFTSPVNINQLTAQTTVAPGYLNPQFLNTGILTAGPGTGFSYGTAIANPLMYLYDESRTSNNKSFVGGKNVGINTITGSLVTPLTITNTTLPARQVPVGNSILDFYVGSTTSTLTNQNPDNATITATGYLNQGNIQVMIFSPTGAASQYLSYHTGTGALINGINQVGNPYPSTITLKQVYADNTAANLLPTFYELNEPGGTYIAYNAADSTRSNLRASKYIVTGQGFMATSAATTTATLTFKEDQKVSYPAGMTATTSTIAQGGTLLLDMKNNFASKSSAPELNATANLAEQGNTTLGGLHLQISKDSATFTQTGIYFGSDRNDAYVNGEDAMDLDGTSPKVYLSSYSSDGKRLSINELNSYTKSKTVKLYAAAVSDGLYNLSLYDMQNLDTMYNVYLRDHYMKDSLDIVKYKNYSFNIIRADTNTYGANRFDLVFELKPMPKYMLASFTGQKISEGVQLNWTAYNAGNYTGFVIEKQGNNNDFSPMYSMQSDGSKAYSIIDHNPVTGNNIYRLQQSDINGNISYSAPITIGYNNVSSSGLFSIYPNPAKDIINVKVNSTTTDVPMYTADIYNTSGMLIDHKQLTSYTWTADVGNYHEGMYIITLKSNSGDVIGKSKFIKVK